MRLRALRAHAEGVYHRVLDAIGPGATSLQNAHASEPDPRRVVHHTMFVCGLAFYSLIWNAAVSSSGRLQHCYEQALRRGLSPNEGELTVEFRLNLGQTTAQDVRIVASNLGDAGFDACVVDTFATLPIPPRQAGSDVVVVRMPVRFHYVGTRPSERGP